MSVLLTGLLSATTVTALLGKIGLSVPLAIMGGVGTFAAVVLAWNQLLQIRDRNEARRPLTAREIEDRIWEWVRRFNITNTRMEAEEKEDFRIVISKDDVDVIIMKPTERLWVIYGTSVVIAEQHKKLLGGRRKELINRLSHEMLRLGISFSIQRDSDREDDVSGVFLQSEYAFSRSTDELAFLTSMGMVRRAAKLAVLIVRDLIDTQPGAVSFGPDNAGRLTTGGS